MQISKVLQRRMQKETSTKHKKECEEHVRLAAKLHDEALFKQPPPDDDCPICFLRLPHLGTGFVCMNCCGKVICRGCIHAVQEKNTVDGLCPFCRIPAPSSDEEMIKRYEKRIKRGDDAQAMTNLGFMYSSGENGLPQNHAKALKLWHRAGELGHTDAYYYISCAYGSGRGVERDAKKAIYYMEIAAMEGDTNSRNNLGVLEQNLGKIDRAIKHYMIAAKGGYNVSVKKIQRLYMNGQATKDYFETALRSYQAYLDEIKSDQRDEAAAFSDEYKYSNTTILLSRWRFRLQLHPIRLLNSSKAGNNSTQSSSSINTCYFIYDIIKSWDGQPLID